MKKKAILFCFFILAAGIYCFGQTQTIDSLKKQLLSIKEKEQRLNALFQLCEHRQSLSSDSLQKYAFEAKRLSLSSKNISQKAWADYYVANYFVKVGQLDTALLLCNNNLVLVDKKKGDPLAWLKFSVLKAHVLVKKNQYKEALSEYYKTLAKSEQIRDTLMQMVAKNGIGWVNMEIGHYPEAIKWFYRAMRTSENKRLHRKISNTYSNMAAVYIDLGKYDSAGYYVQKAIDFAKENENLFFLSNSLNILADNYIHLGKPELAEEPLKKALKIREQIGDPFYLVSDLSQLAIYYAEQSQPQKGIAACLQGIEIAKKYNLTSKLPYLEFALAKNYKAAGNYLAYGETIEKVMALKDSVYQQNSEKELAAIRASYNQQKQQNLIIQQELSINKKNSFIYGSLLIAFFTLVILLILFFNYKRKQELIVEKIKEEEKWKAQEAVSQAEENERKRISADLHDNLGAYASAISANVDDLLASNEIPNHPILQTIKSNADDISNSLNETIWVLNKQEIHLTSVCDRFKNYVSKIRDSYPEINVNITENIRRNTVLSPESALNMLRIMQEAFHNAIKHSKGDSISIDIYSHSKTAISITDNGKGIPQSTNLEGNGISNMQRRAKANGWNLTVKKVTPKGTAVELSI